MVYVTDHLVKARAWAPLRDLLRPQWSAFRATVVVEAGQEDAPQAFWGTLQILVWAHLELGELPEADRLVREFLEWMPSSEVRGQAVDLAKSCGFPAMGEQWVRLSLQNVQLRP